MENPRVARRPRRNAARFHACSFGGRGGSSRFLQLHCILLPLLLLLSEPVTTVGSIRNKRAEKAAVSASAADTDGSDARANGFANDADAIAAFTGRPDGTYAFSPDTGWSVKLSIEDVHSLAVWWNRCSHQCTFVNGGVFSSFVTVFC